MRASLLTRLLVSCALAPVVAVALATTAGLADTPLPARTDRSIYDTADLIDDTEETRLEVQHRELYEKTGVAIAVLTVPALVDETIDELAVRAGQTWGVGKQGQDRGLVIALARDDRKIFVATGYGTEAYLPDGKVGGLIDRHAIPALKQNKFSDGLVALDLALIGESAKQFNTTITGVPEPAAERPVETSRGSGLITLLGIIVFVIIAMRHPYLLMLFGGFGGGGFGGRGRRGGGGGFGGFGGGGFGGGGAGRDF